MAMRLRKRNKSTKKDEPFWMESGPTMKFFGVRLKVKPQDSPLQLLMVERAKLEMADTVDAVAKIKEMGGSVEGLPDLDDDAERDAFVKFLNAKHAARLAIVEWEGVTDPDDETKLADVNEETIDDFISMPGMSVEFLSQYNATILDFRSEQNFSLPAPNGTSEAGKTTVEDAGSNDSHVQKDNEESTESTAHT